MEYRIASFNMKNFSLNSQKDFNKIAEIIVEEDFDIVALQEILSEGKGFKRIFEQQMEYSFSNEYWEFCCASPSESKDLDKNAEMIKGDLRGECYAYIWKKKKFKLMEFSKLGQTRIYEPRILNSKSNDVHADCSFFARTPYYIRLQPKYGGFFELRLLNIHIFYGDKTLSSVVKRKIEYEVLTQDIYPEISKKRYGQNRVAYTVAMGDYNLNIFSPNVQTQDKNCYVSEVHTYSEGKSCVQILTVQDQLTTLKGSEGYANNFDHFTYSPELSNFKSVSYAVVDAIEEYCDGDFAYYQKNISDHLPIVMTVQI